MRKSSSEKQQNTIFRRDFILGSSSQTAETAILAAGSLG
jgi:hypothetical protein